jgi:hypothetical protein
MIEALGGSLKGNIRDGHGRAFMRRIIRVPLQLLGFLKSGAILLIEDLLEEGRVCGRSCEASVLGRSYLRRRKRHSWSGCKVLARVTFVIRISNDQRCHADK